MVPMPMLAEPPKAPAPPPKVPPPKREDEFAGALPPKVAAGLVAPNMEFPPNEAEAVVGLDPNPPPPPNPEGPAVVVDEPKRLPALVVAPPKAGFEPKVPVGVDPKPPRTKQK